jgi:hypothetical protein
MPKSLRSCSAFSLRHRCLAVARLSDHCEARIGLQQPAEAVAEDGVIVGDHDANRLVPVRHGASLEW